MSVCRECKHWHSGTYQPIQGVEIGACDAALDLNEAPNADGAEVIGKALPVDYGNYAAYLYTEASFGCIHFESK